MAIKLCVLLFIGIASNLWAEPQNGREKENTFQPEGGLLNLRFHEGLLHVKLNTPLQDWLPCNAPDILPKSSPLLDPLVLKEKVQATLKFSQFHRYEIAKPEFLVSESVGLDLFLIAGTDVSWTWSMALSNSRPKELELHWSGNKELGLWVNWPGVQQNEFTLKKGSSLLLGAPLARDYRDLIQTQTTLSSPRFITLLFALALGGLAGWQLKHPLLFLLPLVAIWLFWPLEQGERLNPALIKPWLEDTFRSSLLGKSNESPAILYKKLTRTFAGQALEDIYLEKQAQNSNLGLADQKEVEQISLHRVELLDRENPPFSLQVDWTISGVVQHLSHLHVRKTRHLDRLTLDVINGELKVIGFNPIEQRSQRGQ